MHTRARRLLPSGDSVGKPFGETLKVVETAMGGHADTTDGPVTDREVEAFRGCPLRIPGRRGSTTTSRKFAGQGLTIRADNAAAYEEPIAKRSQSARPFEGYSYRSPRLFSWRLKLWPTSPSCVRCYELMLRPQVPDDFHHHFAVNFVVAGNLLH